ncbi:MAG TPA: 30S ribosomal protein S4 [Nitrospinota bacterium]|nr:30S ribosomal protein S4 [Nitrospinota bacterium]
MARYRDSVCRLCRREGMKLFLKGEKCLGEKCAIEKKHYAPGQHGQRRGKLSDYALQLREKQKAKRYYGVLEKQFRNYFKKADKKKGITGEILLRMLECRLDNLTYLMGFANSRSQARQLVRHNHFTINGNKVNIPSYQVKIGDVIEVGEKSRNIEPIKNALERAEQRGLPQWIEVDKKQMKGTIVGLPTREDTTIPIQEQLIVELYSK